MVDADFFYRYLADSTVLPRQERAQQKQDDINYRAALNISSKPCSYRRTSLMCTIGPSCRDVQMLENLIAAGMNIARLNFSYGNHDWHKETIQMIRQAEANYLARVGITNQVAIALDTRGPQIRTGRIDGDVEIEIKKGDVMKLTVDKAYMFKGNQTTVYIDYDNILKVIQPEDRIYISDGTIPLVVTGIHGSNVITQIETSGVLTSYRNVFLPGRRIDLPSVSDEDKNDINFGIRNSVDFILASCVRHAGDITKLRDYLGADASKIKIFAKVQSYVAMRHIDKIIDAADGIYIHRLYLGEEVPSEKGFIAQKTIIARCNRKGKPVFIGKGMVESMCNKRFPTQAESTDIANAIIDGVDGLHISETASGNYPIESLNVISNICVEAEAAINKMPRFRELLSTMKERDLNNIIAASAVEAAYAVGASAIIALAATGTIVYSLTRFKPPMPIIAIVSDAIVAKHMKCYSGIYASIYPDVSHEKLTPDDDWYKFIENRFDYGILVGKVNGFIRSGDPIVMVHGSNPSVSCTNTMRIEYISDIVKKISY